MGVAAFFLAAACAQAQNVLPATDGCAPGSDAAPAALPPYDGSVHDQYILRWRAGELDARQLLAALAEWSRRQPAGAAAAPRLRADLIEIAARAGAFDCAVAGLRPEDVAPLPDYALIPLIQSARATRRTDLQAAAVQTWKQRSPLAWEPFMREAQWLIDAGRLADARAALDALAQRPDAAEPAHRIERLELQGALAEASGEPLLALLHYHELLRLAPDHAYARQFSLTTLAALGGADLALAQAGASDATARQRLGLQADWLAHRLRDALARRDNGRGLERLEALDRVIGDDGLLLDQIAQELGRAAPDAAPAWLALQNTVRADTLVALFERGRYAEAAERYARWQGDGAAALPAWGLAAAGGAYARLRRSDLAIAPYEQALRASDPQAAREIEVSLIYAYLDMGRLDDAQALLDQRSRDIAPYMARTAPQRVANREFDEQQTLRAGIALDTDQIDAGARLFDRMAASAPLNTDMQLGQARVRQLRDHPQAARRLMEAIASDHPDSLAVQLAWADLLLDMGDYDAARAKLETAEGQYPQDHRVARLRERYGRKAAGRVEITAGADKDGGTLASRETNIDTRVYSPVFAGGWRAWGRQVRQYATLDGAHPLTFRTGVGAVYEREPLWVQAEVHRESLRGRTGVEVDSAWRVSDSWRLNAHYDSFSLDTPWRALVRGVRMARADVGVTWIGNEARRVSLTAQHGSFTDGNRRNEWTATWYERWISRPAWQFSTSAELSAGRHTRSDVSYFSPRGYRGEQVWGRLQWLLWKRDQKRLVQVLEAGGGSFWQADHGAKSVAGIRLTHEWTLSDGLTFFYGLSWKRRPYDGVREIQRAVFLGLSIPL